MDQPSRDSLPADVQAAWDAHKDHPDLQGSARHWWRAVQREGLGLTRAVSRALWRHAHQQPPTVAADLPGAAEPEGEVEPSVSSADAAPHAAADLRAEGDADWAPELPQVAKRGRYLFDGECYLTVLPGGESVTTTLAQHQRIQEMYTSMGENRTQLDLCRELGWTLAMVRAYLGAHRIQKSGIPIPHELVAAARTDEDIEELAVNNTARNYGRTLARIQHLSRKLDARDAYRWRHFEVHTLPLLQQALTQHVTTPPVVPRVDLPPAHRPWSVLVGVTDFHWGMRSFSEESGFEYNRRVARRRLEDVLSQFVAYLRRHGQPDRILLPIGSDWLHVDGIGTEARTTRGTPQHVDGSPGEIFVTGLDLLRETVTGLSQIAPVLAVPCRGNHDDHSAMSLSEVLRERARWDDRLEVAGEDRRLAKQQALVEQGVLLGVKHGHTGRGGPHTMTRLRNDRAWLEHEARRLGYHGYHKVIVGGHTHHLEVEGEGVRHMTLRALCDPDLWHADKGYIHTPPGLHALVLEQGRGQTHTLLFVCDESEDGKEARG